MEFCKIVQKHQDKNNGGTDMKWFEKHVKTCDDCKKIIIAVTDTLISDLAE